MPEFMKYFRFRTALVSISMLLSIQLFGVIEEEPSVLWRVSDGDSHIYLLGSIHMLRPTDYPLREIYQVAFDQVDGLAIESDISQESDIIDYLDAHVYYPSGTLSQDFSFSSITKVKTWFRQNGFQFSSSYQPWFLYTLIQEVEIYSAYTATGVDNYFLQQANSRRLPVEYLESWQVAIDYIIAMPPDLAESLIRDLIDSSNDAIDQINELIDSWNQSDIAALELYTDDGYTGGPVNPLSVSGRTLSWLPKVRGYLADNRKFLVIAGAAHMVGDYGLPELLEKEGYTVERLPEAPWAELVEAQAVSSKNLFRTKAVGAMGEICIIETTTDLNDPNSWKRYDAITLTDEQTTIEIPYTPFDEKLFVRGRIVKAP